MRRTMATHGKICQHVRTYNKLSQNVGIAARGLDLMGLQRGYNGVLLWRGYEGVTTSFNGVTIPT